MNLPVLVVGGGIAGSAAATLLARAGRPVVVIEQQREPRHKVCGEFLSTEACQSLQQLGIDLSALGAVRIDSVRLLCGESRAETALPFRALSLTRRRLDRALLDLAATAGAELQLGRRVERVTASADDAPARSLAGTRRALQNGCGVCLSGGDRIAGSALFLATGKHDLRDRPRPEARGAKLVAFKQYFRLVRAQQDELARAVELHLFPGGYAGLQLVEQGMANLCLLIQQNRLRALGGHWRGVLDHLAQHAPALAERLRDAEPQLAQPLALSHIPYGFLAEPQPGPWRLGDQAAVIPSFTGDGMSIALHTAAVTVQQYLAGATPEVAAAHIRCDLGPSLRRATALARLLLTPGVRRAAVWGAAIAPAAMVWSALATRIPQVARERLARNEAMWPGTAAYNEHG